MKKMAKRWLTVGALVVIAGFAGVNALAYSHAGAMLRFSDGGPRTTTPERLGLLSRINVLLAGVNIPRPWSHRHPSDLAPDCRLLSGPEPGGVTLASWYCNRGRGTPVVILFHGYSAIGLAEARPVLEAVAGTKEFVTFEQSGYEAYLSNHAKQWRTAVESFIKRT